MLQPWVKTFCGAIARAARIGVVFTLGRINLVYCHIYNPTAPGTKHEAPDTSYPSSVPAEGRLCAFGGKPRRPRRRRANGGREAPPIRRSGNGSLAARSFPFPSRDGLLNAETQRRGERGVSTVASPRAPNPGNPAGPSREASASLRLCVKYLDVEKRRGGVRPRKGLHGNLRSARRASRKVLMKLRTARRPFPLRRPDSLRAGRPPHADRYVSGARSLPLNTRKPPSADTERH